jgi:hypothetical protein
VSDRPSNVNAVVRNRPEIADTNLRLAKDNGIEVTKDGYLVLYHGTRSENKIAHGGVLKVGTYLSNRKTAEEFARAAQQAGRPTVMRLEVPPGAVMSSGGNDAVYFSLNEPLQLVKGTGKANYIYQMNVAEHLVDELLREDEEMDINDFMRDHGTMMPSWVSQNVIDYMISIAAISIYDYEMDPGHETEFSAADLQDICAALTNTVYNDLRDLLYEMAVKFIEPTEEQFLAFFTKTCHEFEGEYGAYFERAENTPEEEAKAIRRKMAVHAVRNFLSMFHVGTPVGESDEQDINDFMRDHDTFVPNTVVVPEQVVYSLLMEPEQDIDLRGHFDNAEDVRWVREQLANGNQWAWCITRVEARWNDGHRTFKGESNWLGGCSYRSEADFKQPGGYYDDMKKEAYDDLVSKVEAGEAEEDSGE